MVVIGVCSLAIPAMPSLVHMLDLKRIGEVAGRSLYPCLPQVAINAVRWLRSHHNSCGDHGCTPAFGSALHTFQSRSLMVRLLIRVGAGDISTHRCE